MTRGLWRKTFNVSFPRPGCMFRGNPPCGRLHPLTETYQVAEQFQPHKTSTPQNFNPKSFIHTFCLIASANWFDMYLEVHAVSLIWRSEGPNGPLPEFALAKYFGLFHFISTGCLKSIRTVGVASKPVKPHPYLLQASLSMQNESLEQISSRLVH